MIRTRYKKLITISLITLLLMLLTGCGGDQGITGSRLVVYVQEATPTGAPIGDATVMVRNTGDESSNKAIIARQLNVSNGPGNAYIFDGLPPDKYTVTVDCYGYKPAQSSGDSTVANSEIYLEDGLDYTLTVYMERSQSSDTGIVEGHVREKGTGNSIADVTVSIISNNVGYTDITAADGSYNITDIPISGQPLTIYAYPPTPDWEVFNGNVLVASSAAGPTQYDIELNPTGVGSADSSEVGNLEFTLVLRSSNPASNGNYVYYNLDFEKSGVHFVTVFKNNNTGISYSSVYDGEKFVFNNLPNGSYILENILPENILSTSPGITININGNDVSSSGEGIVASNYDGKITVHVKNEVNDPGIAGWVAYSLVGDNVSFQTDEVGVGTNGSVGDVIDKNFTPAPWGEYSINVISSHPSIEVEVAGDNIKISAVNPSADVWIFARDKQ